jgi:hypothetical protein
MFGISLIGLARALGFGIVAAIAVTGACAAAGFLTTAADVPLMDGLDEVRGGLVFDNPGGRIVESYATGAVDAAAVTQFYGETLPHLGWQARGNLTFEREGERLKLHLQGVGGALTVRFEISPR